MNNNYTFGIIAGIALGVILILALQPATAKQDIFFIEKNTGTGCTDLDCLTDVILINTTNGQILIYNSTTNAFENEDTAFISTNATCTNLGAGTIICASYSGNNLNFKSLIGGRAITLSNTSNTITIDHDYMNITFITTSYQATNNDETILCNPSISTTVVNLTSPIIVGKEFTIKKISNNGNECSVMAKDGTQFIDGNGLSINYVVLSSPFSSVNVIGANSSHWFISSAFQKCRTNIGTSLCNTNTAVELGQIDIQLKGLNSGTGISLSSASNTVSITNSLPEATSASNLGSSSSLSEGVFASEVVNDLQFKRLLESSGITLSSNSTHITITNALPENTVCNNVGTGNQLCSGGNVNIDTLIAGTGITITDTTDDWTIASTVVDTDNQIAQEAGSVYLSLTKTNIGTAYIDIYVTAFDEEDMMVVDCANVTYGKVVYIWDYVGVGTQQLRWVDASNNANVFYESPTFTTDRDATDSGFFAKPSWCTTTVTLEQQGKSTTAGDDPVAKGYKIVIK